MRKPTIVIMVLLEILSLSGGIIGYLEHTRNNKQIPGQKENKYKITYKYYLDGVEVATMPRNIPKEVSIPDEEVNPDETTPTEEEIEEENIYSFDKYICTNNVEGTFDNEKWEFIPKQTSDATCKLYFVTNIFDVTLNVNNGKLDELSASNNPKVKKGEKITYTIKPNDGYKYDTNSNCNNGALLDWNQGTNILTVSEVTANTTCNINYIINSYNINVETENGVAKTESATVEHGKNTEFEFTPNENMVYDSFTCDPQIKAATYDTASNKLILSNITSNSKCKVAFKQNAFKVTLIINNGEIVGDSTKDVKKSGYVVFDIKENEGYTTNQAEATCNNGNIELNGTLVKVSNITQDTECSITLKTIAE